VDFAAGVLGAAWVLEVVTVTLLLTCVGAAALVSHAVAPAFRVAEGLSPTLNALLVGLIAVGLVSFVASLVVPSCRRRAAAFPACDARHCANGTMGPGCHGTPAKKAKSTLDTTQNTTVIQSMLYKQ
jgi:hypothetical protein